MKKPQPKYLFLIPLVAFLLSTISFVFGLAFISLQLRPARSDIYLQSLRDEPQIGCSTLDGSQLEYLILGDSHTYSAIDFVTFTKQLQTNSIGVCALGGFYFETMLQMIRSAKTSLKNSKYFIYGLSYRQFTDGDNKSAQLFAHQKITSSIENQSRFGLLSLNAKMNDALNYQKSNRQLLKRRADIEKWTTIISTLDSKKVDYLFLSHQNKSATSWAKYLQLAQINSKFSQLAKDFCDFVNENKLQVVLVDIPESPYLSGLYSEKQHQDYTYIKNTLSQCAILYLDKSIFGELNSNKYFVNRTMEEAWLNTYNAGQLSKDSHLENLYDYDHLNIIGAQLFTQKLTAALNLHLGSQ